MSDVDAEQLQEFVDFLGKYGGDFGHPAVVEKYYPLNFKYKTVVDQSLDPFSDEYFQAQMQLYREIAGRNLDQWTGELHPLDIETLKEVPNPTGSLHSSTISEQSRAVSLMLSLLDLGEQPSVLDMGSGAGLSSEMLAFCGCDVHSVDIDPGFAELSAKRSASRNLSIQRHLLNFDDISSLPDQSFDAAFFFQSLHHCLKPWELLSALKCKLKDDSCIVFTGEPINSLWWKNWGIRLDPESLYAAKNHGWFESGWSREFLQSCFERAGLQLHFFSHGYGGGDVGVASTSASALSRVAASAAKIGVVRRTEQNYFQHAQFASPIGGQTAVLGGPGLKTEGAADGFLCSGPYATIPSGKYRVTFALQKLGNGKGGQAVVDVISDRGNATHFEQTIDMSGRPFHLVDNIVTLGSETHNLEVRVLVTGGNEWACTLPEMTRVSSDAHARIARILRASESEPAAIAKVLAEKQAHRATIDRLWADRHSAEQELRATARELELTLRNELKQSERRAADQRAELSRLEERTAQLQEQLSRSDAAIRDAEQRLSQERQQIAFLTQELDRRDLLLRRLTD